MRHDVDRAVALVGLLGVRVPLLIYGCVVRHLFFAHAPQRFPGCMPDGEPMGPFETGEEADAK
jgi:hypothetical protein